MIKIKINGKIRSDVEIQAGGTLTQTEEHTTESNLSVKVPIDTDDLKNYDYIQIYSADDLIFAGNILSKNQQMLSTGYTGLDYRMYDLTLASNADLVANILVDMSFPRGATITQILRGNHPGDVWFDTSLGEFYGLIETRIIPEGVTLGEVDDYDNTALESTSYLWGEGVKSLLDTLADLTLSYWEITNDKVFNFRRKSNDFPAPMDLTADSPVFDVGVDNDSLATYSAVRVIGGEGAGAPRTAYATMGEDYKTAEFAKSLAGIKKVALRQISTGKNIEAAVGYRGIHDDDPTKPVLMTYGGTTLACKDDYIFVSRMFTGVSFLQKIMVRQTSTDAQVSIARNRGGTGLIEYILEDDSILNYNDAVLNATRFLESHNRPIQTVRFSTFTPGFSPGQRLRGDIAYYKVSGDYWVSSVEAEFVVDGQSGLVCVYHVECTSSLYRDYYKVLFYSPKALSFDLGAAGGNNKGVSHGNDLDLLITLRVNKSNIPTWDGLNGTKWSTLTIKTWLDIYAFAEEVYTMGNYTTDTVRNLYAQFAHGDMLSKSAAEVYSAAKGLPLTGSLDAASGTGSLQLFAPESVTPLSGNGFTTTYYIMEDEAQYKIKSLNVVSNTNSNQNAIEIPVDIDKSKSNPEGEFALTVAISCEVK